MNKTGKRVLFVGDINVDLMMHGLQSLPQVDREITCTGFETTMGSTAVIAACAYAALGGQAAFLGLAGEDAYGDFMLDGMRAFGIDTARVLRTRDVNTGVTVNLIHDRTRSQVTYPGTIAAFDGDAVSDDVLDGFAHVHFAGPYQQVRFMPHIARLLQAARSRGLTTSLDPQWDQLEKWACMDVWMPLLDYLFLNEDEARSISGQDSLESALPVLVGRTACPVIKAGRAGALLFVNGRVRRFPTYRAEVRDTTGAGDSFDAGWLYACIERGLPLEESADFANAVAARSCLFSGGVNARSTCADIEAFQRRDYERI
jgi:sugar/nucleoside kinase (ribokinase family)